MNPVNFYKQNKDCLEVGLYVQTVLLFKFTINILSYYYNDISDLTKGRQRKTHKSDPK